MVAIVPGNRLLLADVASTSAAVAASSSRLAKIDALAGLLRRAAPADVPLAVAYLSGDIPATGAGWAALRSLPPATAELPSYELTDVEADLERLRSATGAGSQQLRRDVLTALFARLTGGERTFLLSLLSGGLRQGAAAGVMVEAVARAVGVPVADVRRALLVAGDLPAVAGAALGGGLDALRLEVLRPLRPMLAQSAANPGEALARICPAAVEWKVDGVRVQIHRSGQEVKVFTRNLAEVTGRVPEVVELVRAGPERVVIDGELIALRPDSRPRRFQETMGRFGNRAAAAFPLTLFAFDCLHLDGEDLIDRPESDRFAALAGAFPAATFPALAVPRQVLDSVPAAEGALDAAIEAGHEGIMVKALDAPYEAGRRGAGWLKVKRAHTLDLAVLAAEWGHGRRQGYLSNLHLGARGPGGEFVMLGKTFKGMTDQVLAWQTEQLAARETHREGITVYVRPELVVEVAFDGIQESSRYPGGMALRFARIKGYRPDKSAQEADTIETVRALFEAAR